VLQGQVVVEIVPEEGSKDPYSNFTLTQGQKMQVSEIYLPQQPPAPTKCTFTNLIIMLCTTGL
jgi:hypothetical protein